MKIQQTPVTYRMKAMIFDVSSSPFLAQFMNNFNAMIYEDEFPKAAKAIVNQHNVDDY
jgi:hypothetical protein